MRSSRQPSDDLAESYRIRYDLALVPLAEELSAYIRDIFSAEPRIDRISARAKHPASFLKKAAAQVNGKPKYGDPLSQIQDQVGARIIAFYKSDVERVDAIVKRFFSAIEFRDRVPESGWEFGYFGRHYVLVFPSDVVSESIDRTHIPDFFELQIKTLFQHAWSEAEHDLGYKLTSLQLNSEEKRKLAYTSAQAWGADQIFDELFQARNHAK
jgi:putative GTP pyrophosphokinase